MIQEELLLNDHNKEEFPPAHTAEHLLNQLMMRMFGCERSNNAHVERKKSKITYILDRKPDRKEEKDIEVRMNELIREDLPVTFEYVTRVELEGMIMEADPDSPDAKVSLDRLPDNSSDRYAWFELATMMFARVSENMFVLLHRLVVSSCWVPTGTTTNILSEYVTKLFSTLWDSIRTGFLQPRCPTR